MSLIDLSGLTVSHMLVTKYQSVRNKITKKTQLVNHGFCRSRWAEIEYVLWLKGEKIDLYLDLTRDLQKKKKWNMKMTVIPVLNCILGMVHGGFEKNFWKRKIRWRKKKNCCTVKLEYWEESWRASMNYSGKDFWENPLGIFVRKTHTD